MSTNLKCALAALAAVLTIAVIGATLYYWNTLFPQLPMKPSPMSCIQLPEVSNEAERSAALEAAAKLEKLPLDAKFKVNFEDKAKVVFQTLTDKQVAFLLLVRAIECYMKEAADNPEKLKLVEKLVPELIATVRALWASTHDLKGVSGDRLSLQELSILKKSSYGPPILKELQRYGINE